MDQRSPIYDGFPRKKNIQHKETRTLMYNGNNNDNGCGTTTATEGLSQQASRALKRARTSTSGPHSSLVCQGFKFWSMKEISVEFFLWISDNFLLHST